MTNYCSDTITAVLKPSNDVIYEDTVIIMNSQRSSKDFNFNNDDADIEGSGYHGEVTQDLESSGSGFGPDDEDDPDVDKSRSSYVPAVNNPPPPIVEEGIGEGEVATEKEPIEKEKSVPVPTEDSTVTMNKKSEDRPASFFAQPGILAECVKKDEGSYALGEPKQSPNSNSYSRGTNKEFFA
ncbi:hypothetical protein NQ315_010326 [Exocentrus adspersus]|uniref:Syndecan/Neurexin domain-containing protein n=1 Tax=Exocentrus adspersus TaxID=1586481 RepID=A0AAV8WBZ9_9CUCU|nr:hypothetical protein NQ315_010326 [Exocentrus adspersus]